MHWYLIISMFSTDELLVKQMNTKKECISIQKQITKTIKHNKDVRQISCEQAEIMEQIDEKIIQQEQHF